MESGSRTVSSSYSGSGSSSSGGSSYSGSSSRGHHSSKSPCCSSSTQSRGYFFGENNSFYSYSDTPSGYYSGSHYGRSYSHPYVIVPNWGTEVSKRQATRNATPIYHETGTFFYKDGIFYFNSSSAALKNKYFIKEPCVGLRVKGLPMDRRGYELNGVKYYYYYGTFYTYDAPNKEFVVVAPPVGAVVDWIPSRSKKMKNEENFYCLDGKTLYKVSNSNLGVRFEVVESSESLLSNLSEVANDKNIELLSEVETMYPNYGEIVSKRTATKKSQSIYHESGVFYYRDGIFYHQEGDKYMISAPQIGFQVKNIPDARRVYVLNDKTYYYYYGTFFSHMPFSGDFVVVAPPVGAVVEWIPSTSNSLEIEGDTYYFANGIQYRSIMSDGKKWYRVIAVDKNLYSVK